MIPSPLEGIVWGLALRALFVVVALLHGDAALAQTAGPSFPALTGRVVDAAGILTGEQRAALEAKLKGHEDKTSDQIVVATVRSLGGLPVEDYANRLFRTWKIGQADKNNGVLLLVAPSERKLRFEVGYGLEGALTDALTKVIITTAIAPRFKQGDYFGGIDAGVDAVVSILTGDAEEWQRRARVRHDERAAIDPVVAFLVLLVVLWLLSRLMRGGRGGGRRFHRTRRGDWIVLPVPSGGGGGWGGGGDFGGGGGFSGGGGSSGGGGASGDW